MSNISLRRPSQTAPKDTWDKISYVFYKYAHTPQYIHVYIYIYIYVYIYIYIYIDTFVICCYMFSYMFILIY